MSNQLWTIFPDVVSSQLVDVLDATCICDQKNEQIAKLVSRHLFSQTIQIVSESAQLKEAVRDYVAETSELGFLLVKNLPIYALIDPAFLSAYVKKGKLYGLTVNRDVNVDDTVALLPNQILLLSVNAESYYKLGLIGEKSTLNKKKNLVEKYRITIDLGQKCFKADKKNYQRVLECLKRTQMKCDFIMKWTPHKTGISANSLFQYFEHVQKNSPEDVLLSKISLHKCYPAFRTFTNRKVTSISNINSKSEDSVNNFIEWVNAQVAEVNCDDILINTAELCDVHCVEVKGFFTSSNVSELLEKLKSCLSNQEFSALVVHGFEDSPQCWSGRNNEHYKNISGENIFGIGQLKETVLSWCIVDEYDFGIEKL